jgi:hypothetical protein
MQRRSAYLATATTSSGVPSSRPVTPPNELATDAVMIKGNASDYHDNSQEVDASLGTSHEANNSKAE